MSKNLKRLTVEELKTYPGLENLTDEQAKQVIDTLETHASILFDIYIHKKNSQDEKSFTV